MDAKLEKHVEFLRDIPWFSALGEPVDGVRQIASWEDWPGPDTEATDALNDDLQECHDSLLRESTHPVELKELMDAVRELVWSSATKPPGFDPEEDAWHGPMAAALHASWLAGLVAGYRAAGVTVPALVQESWRWFSTGHWPFMYDEDFVGQDANGLPRLEGLVIF